MSLLFLATLNTFQLQKVTPPSKKKVKYYENNLYLINILMIVELDFIQFFIYPDSFPHPETIRRHEIQPARGDNRQGGENREFPFSLKGNRHDLSIAYRYEYRPRGCCMWQLKIKLYRGEFIAVARHVRKKSMFDLSGGDKLIHRGISD
jgi:hypothetical protein